MSCLYPKKMMNPKYKANFKNKGNIPMIKHPELMYIDVKCGICWKCKKQKAREILIRLDEEILYNNKLGIKGNFVTFTYSDESLVKLQREIQNKLGKKIEETSNTKEKINNKKKLMEYAIDNEIAILSIKRWRELVRQNNLTKPPAERTNTRYWLITELGGTNTQRLHLHAIIFTNNIEEVVSKWKYGYAEIGRKGPNGTTINYVNHETIGYLSKYVTKTDLKHKNYKARILCSKGIGKEYINRPDAKRNAYKGKETNQLYTNKKGYKMAMPNYIRRKIYNEDQIENLNIFNIETGIKFVENQKIDITTEEGKEFYKKAIENLRQKNIRMGYPSGIINEEELKQEREIRKAKSNERIKKVYAVEQRKNKNKKK